MSDPPTPDLSAMDVQSVAAAMQRAVAAGRLNEIKPYADELRRRRAAGQLGSGMVVSTSGPMTISLGSTVLSGGTGAASLAAIMQTAMERFAAGGAMMGVGGFPFAPAVAGPGPGIEAIRRRDPGFDPDAFVARTQRCFYLVVESWTRQDPAVCRAVVSDGVWEQLRLQNESLVHQGRRDVIDHLRLRASDIVGAVADDTADHITVAMSYSCADYIVDARGHRVHGSDKPRDKVDRYTFSRAAGSLTPPPTAGPRHCATCGAPLAAELAGVCSYCHAPVAALAAEWVVARIEQVSGAD